MGGRVSGATESRAKAKGLSRVFADSDSDAWKRNYVGEVKSSRDGQPFTNDGKNKRG